MLPQCRSCHNYRKNLGHETQPLQAQWSVPTCWSWNRLPSTEINRCQLGKWPHAGWGQHEVIYMPICPSSSDRFTASIFIESSRNLSIVWTITQGIAAFTQYSGIFLGCWADHGYVEFFVILLKISRWHTSWWVSQLGKCWDLKLLRPQSVEFFNRKVNQLSILGYK
jgi:hypothetical protein